MIVGKSFTISDPQAIARDDQFQPRKDANGNNIIIPEGTKVEVTAVHINPSDLVDFIKVKTWGWTSRLNFSSGLQNEILRVIIPEFLSDDDGQRTVTDPEALIRIKNGNSYLPDGRIIPLGEFVIIKKRTLLKKYVKVAFTRKVDNKYVEDTNRNQVWTSKDNLSDGWFDVFGLTSVWDEGKYTGRSELYSIIGKGGDVEYVAKEYYDEFLALVEGAKNDNITIQLTSGFRTWRRQKELYDLYKAGIGNLAARPGFSNHQQGMAFDLNTEGFNTPVYNWLKNNGPKFGFLRTVNNEHWHWEYRPADAKTHGFKLPSVVV